MPVSIFFFHFRCVIAALFTEYQLSIYTSPTFGTKWKEAIDISQVLHGYLKQNNFELRQDVMQETSLKNTGVSIGSDYALFKQRTQILAFTCLHWFSQLYHIKGITSLNEKNKTSENKQFAVLVTGNQSGALIFWKVTIPVIMNSAQVQIGGFLNTQQSWPCSLSWKQITDNQGIVIQVHRSSINMGKFISSDQVLRLLGKLGLPCQSSKLFNFC